MRSGGETIGLIKEISRYTTVDGEGIRSIIYLMGCHMRCAWCSSPLTWKKQTQVFVHREKCTGCGKCATVCPSGAIKMTGGKPLIAAEKCTACGSCAKACPNGAIKLYGKAMSADSAAKILSRDALFYEETGGGVTVSGGEPLVQRRFTRELARLLKGSGINTALETTLNFPWHEIEETVHAFDTRIVDIKTMDEADAISMTGLSNAHTLNNIKRLCKDGKAPDVNYPYIPGFNDGEKNIRSMADFLNDNGISRLRLLPYHKLGVAEYDGLCLFEDMRRVREIAYPSDDGIKRAVEMLTGRGISVKYNEKLYKG